MSVGLQKELLLQKSGMDISSSKTNGGSHIAKGGFHEESLVVKDINTNIDLRLAVIDHFGLAEDLKLEVKTGNSKTDILDPSKSNMRFQVKKGSKGQIGQLDRHWVESVTNVIPKLEPIKTYLKALCEYGLSEDGKMIDKKKPRKLLDTKNYTQFELDTIIEVLELAKSDILSYVFEGHEPQTKPNFFVYVNYEKGGKRDRIRIWKVKDIIEYCKTLKFSISQRCSVIKLGTILSFQRKGGDGGRPSSNQLQTKIIASNIPESLDDLQCFEYIF